jgi:hypothetical protein
MGQAKGFPDLIIYQLIPGITRPAAIEFKIKNNKLTPEQENWLNYFSSIGYITGVVRTFSEYKLILDQILGIK